MESMILMIVVVFLALVGLTNLILGIRRWLSHSGKLGDCMLVMQLESGDTEAEAKLVQGLEALRLTPGLSGVRLGVVCPPGEAQSICRTYSENSDILLCDSWSELETMLRR